VPVLGRLDLADDLAVLADTDVVPLWAASSGGF
jgi:hypothetical protein